MPKRRVKTGAGRPAFLPLFREKVASAGEPEEGPGRRRRNKDSFGLASARTLTLPLTRVPPSPARGRGAFAADIFTRSLKRLMVILLALAPICAQAQDGGLPVVASFSVLGDLVRQIGGDDVRVDTLVGADGDAHVFQPSPGDARRLTGARLFVVNGLNLEGWMPRLIASAGFKGEVVVATRGVVPLQMTAEGRALPDPHAWQDLANGRIYVENIAAALTAADPGHAADYARRARAYQAELAELDRWVKAEIAAVPAEKRKIITTHDAFRYFGRAYGIEFRAPVGMSEDGEPTAGTVATLIRTIRRDRIKALFIENMTDSRLIEQLARETGADLGGALFADALSRPGEGGETYAAMFRHNVPAMVAAMAHN
jgi:zinc/manganese transport system substrate-binding protein